MERARRGGNGASQTGLCKHLLTANPASILSLNALLRNIYIYIYVYNFKIIIIKKKKTRKTGSRH